MKKIIPVVMSIALLTVSSCKKLTDSIDKAGSKGTLSATINGKTYTAGNVTTTVTSNAFMFKGAQSSNDESLTISINKYNAGTNKYNFDLIYNTANYYDTKSHHAVSGEIQIESTGDKSAKGTFYFKADDSLEVKDGKFDINWN